MADVAYFPNHSFEASTVIVPVLRCPDSCPLCVPGNLLGEREIDGYALSDGDSWDQHIQQFCRNGFLSFLGLLIVAPSKVLLIMVVPILTSRDRCLVHSDVGWGGSSLVGCATSFFLSIQVDQKSTIVADTFTLPPSLIGLPDVQVLCPDDGIQFRVMLHPAVTMLVVALLVLGGCSRARKVVVILFGIEVRGAVGVLAEGPVHVVAEIVGSGGKRCHGMVPAV
jgi:hypothetical protein